MADLIFDEAHLFAVCVLLGAFLAFVYDAIRIFRFMFRHADWLVDVEDLLYWIYTAWTVFRTLFQYNQGVLRGYVFVGMFVGVTGYLLTLSSLLLFLVRKGLPFWEQMKRHMKIPFGYVKQFVRKTLKNIATSVTMAIRGR